MALGVDIELVDPLGGVGELAGSGVPIAGVPVAAGIGVFVAPGTGVFVALGGGVSVGIGVSVGGTGVSVGGTGVLVGVGVNPANTIVDGRCENKPINTTSDNGIAIQYCRF